MIRCGQESFQIRSTISAGSLGKRWKLVSGSGSTARGGATRSHSISKHPFKEIEWH
jgi:hypothetical protein